jgi:hypothetical protein
LFGATEREIERREEERGERFVEIGNLDSRTGFSGSRLW